MRQAKTILTVLGNKAKADDKYVFQGLYRLLYNPAFYLDAYAKIYTKEGNMTPGVDGATMDGFSLEWIDEIIEQMKQERYAPNPARRAYIPKKNGKLRPLGIPCVKDKIVQEVMRAILEAIYEPVFLDSSHGYRPNRSCHTALTAIKQQCTGSVWVIEGDIKGFFDNIDHNKLLEILQKRIKDGRFLELIRRFLQAGYLERDIKYNTYSGTPQGGILSPILANIYLHELDHHVQEIVQREEKGEKKRGNPAYTHLCDKRIYARRTGRKEAAQAYLKAMMKLPSKDPNDPNYVRVRYYRYADDFVIFVIGSKKLTTSIRDDIKSFLEQELKIELNAEKSVITHLDNKVRFLGYDITKIRDDHYLIKGKGGIKRRHINGKIALLVPYDVIHQKIQKFSANGKPAYVAARFRQSVLEILVQYNAEIRGLYNYYCLANDVAKRLYWFQYYHYSSLLRTLACKLQLSCAQIVAKHGIEVKRKDGQGTRKIFGVEYKTKKGSSIMTYFNNPLVKKETGDQQAQVDATPNGFYEFSKIE